MSDKESGFWNAIGLRNASHGVKRALRLLFWALVLAGVLYVGWIAYIVVFYL